MTDATLTSLDAILKSGDYEIIDNVPIFDAHDEHDKEGKLVRSFRRAELQAIADKCNQRAIDTGDLAPFGPGHTIDGAPETSQPPVYGYAKDFTVGHFGPASKLAILCKFYIKKSHKALAASFPRRSVELWVKDKMIDWIALLRRTPQRDLGLLTYVKEAQFLTHLHQEPLFYDALKQKHLAGHLSLTGKLRYSMDFDMDPTAAPNAMAPDAQFQDMFMKCMKACFPQLEGMHAKYAGEVGAKPPAPLPGPPTGGDDDVEGGGEGDDDKPGKGSKDGKGAKDGPSKNSAQLSATNSSLPESEKLRMSKVQEDITQAQLKSENDALKARLAKLEESQVATMKEIRKARYERDLTGLVGQGYQFDLAEEMEMHGDDLPEKFAKHLESIKKNYQRGPVGDLPFIGQGVDDAPIAGKQNDDINDPKNIGKFEKATKYMRETGKGWDEAEKYAMANGKAA